MTRNMIHPIAGAALAAFAALALPAGAEDRSGTNGASAPSAETGPTGVAAAALALAEFGREAGDPTVLIGAARTLQLIGRSTGDDSASGEGAAPADVKAPGGEAAEKPAEGEAADRDVVAELLGEARFLARGDTALLARADAVEQAATRGNTGGPQMKNWRLQARKYLDHKTSFRGGETAEALLIGDGDTDVDLVIYDQNGNKVCESTGGRDREFCRWQPVWTGEFTIRVINYGRVYNDVIMMTN